MIGSTDSLQLRTFVDSLVSISDADREILLKMLNNINDRLDSIERILTNVVVDTRLMDLRKKVSTTHH